MKAPNKEVERAFDRCKIQLMMKGSVFITTVAFSLKVIWTDTEVPTAGVDGTHLWFNTKFFMDLTETQRVGLYAHEIWHVCFRHMERKDNKDPELWNDAGDHLINLMLLGQKYELPPNGLHDPQYEGMSTLEIYDLLPKKKGKGNGQGQNQSSGAWGNDVIQRPMTPESMNTLTSVLTRAITQSEMSNEAPGTVPGEIKRNMHELLNPKLPWNHILQRFLTSQAKDDYSWRRSNRRFQPDFYLPSAYSESLANISVAIDVSGSVSKDDFTRFLSELSYVQKSMKPEQMTVFNFDTQLGDIHQVSEANPVEDLPFTGGGGTNISPVLDWALDNRPTVLVIFTDGQFLTYEPDIKTPILWIIYDNPNFQSGLGEIVHYGK